MTAEWLTTVLILGGVFVFLFCLERWIPLRKPRHGLARRLFANLAISALALVAAAVLVDPAGIRALEFASDRGVGLLRWAGLSPIAEFMIDFALLDLTFYYWHLANHKLAFLWRFHNVHHIDPDLDVSTSFRFHFAEVAMSAGFRIIQIAALGVSPVTFATYELAFQIGTLFHHSNVRLPIVLERWLNLVIVTPRMHGIHHSKVFDEVNSNWSSVFSWWDRLHGTLRVDVPQSAIDIGVPGYSLSHDNSVRAVLAMPFQKQRPYWPDSGFDDKRTTHGEKRMRLAE